MIVFYYFFFFFQAEDGIRDKLVTGVQTCALPIYLGWPAREPLGTVASVQLAVRAPAPRRATRHGVSSTSVRPRAACISRRVWRALPRRRRCRRCASARAPRRPCLHGTDRAAHPYS